LINNEELSSNEMVNKFIETANKVGDKVHARVPCDLKGLKGSAFHCPYYIKKTLINTGLYRLIL